MRSSRGRIRTQEKMTIILKISLYVLLAAVVLLTIGSVIAKYIYSNRNHSSVVASEFYFESDYLTTDGIVYELATDTDSIDFVIKNHPDSLRYSKNDITYTLTIKEDGATYIEKVGTLKGKRNSDETITISDMKNGSTYEVTVLGEAGFEKTLSATFKVRDGQKNLYKSIEDNYEYLDLSVWAENVSGNLTVRFPNSTDSTRIVLPDNVDPAVGNNAKTVDGYFTDTQSFAEKYSSHKYRFYKPYPGTVFTADDFEVTCADADAGTITATVKAPDR